MTSIRPSPSPVWEIPSDSLWCVITGLSYLSVTFAGMDAICRNFRSHLVRMARVGRQGVWLLGAGALLVACTDVPGEGGNGVLRGRIELERRVTIANPAGAVVVPGQDVEVYLTYGDRVGPDDRVWTNYDGEFAFYWLRPGPYTLYVYSEDTLPLPDRPPLMTVVREVEIVGRRETVDVGVMRIYDER